MDNSQPGWVHAIDSKTVTNFAAKLLDARPECAAVAVQFTKESY